MVAQLTMLLQQLQVASPELVNLIRLKPI